MITRSQAELQQQQQQQPPILPGGFPEANLISPQQQTPLNQIAITPQRSTTNSFIQRTPNLQQPNMFGAPQATARVPMLDPTLMVQLRKKLLKKSFKKPVGTVFLTRNEIHNELHAFEKYFAMVHCTAIDMYALVGNMFEELRDAMDFETRFPNAAEFNFNDFKNWFIHKHIDSNDGEKAYKEIKDKKIMQQTGETINDYHYRFMKVYERLDVNFQNDASIHNDFWGGLRNAIQDELARDFRSNHSREQRIGGGFAEFAKHLPIQILLQRGKICEQNFPNLYADSDSMKIASGAVSIETLYKRLQGLESKLNLSNASVSSIMVKKAKIPIPAEFLKGKLTEESRQWFEEHAGCKFCRVVDHEFETCPRSSINTTISNYFTGCEHLFHHWYPPVTNPFSTPDALSYSWTSLPGIFMCPPLNLLLPTIQKIISDLVQKAIVLAPQGNRSLERLSIARPVLLGISNMAAYLVSGCKRGARKSKFYSVYTELKTKPEKKSYEIPAHHTKSNIKSIQEKTKNQLFGRGIGLPPSRANNTVLTGVGRPVLSGKQHVSFSLPEVPSPTPTSTSDKIEPMQKKITPFKHVSISLPDPPSTSITVASNKTTPIQKKTTNQLFGRGIGLPPDRVNHNELQDQTNPQLPIYDIDEPDDTSPPIWSALEDKQLFDAFFNEIQIKVHIDSGSSGNIVSNEFVLQHHLPTVTTVPRIIQVADGRNVVSNCSVSGIFQKGSYKKYLEFAVAPINDTMILGIPWRQTVVITEDWCHHSLQFYTVKSGPKVKHTWYGCGKQDPRLKIHQISSVALQQIHDAEIYEININPVDDELLEDTNLSRITQFNSLCSILHKPEIQKIALNETDQSLLGNLESRLAALVEEYHMIFGIPHGLPVSRPENMEIKTIPNAKVPFRPLSRLSTLELESLKEKLDELIAKGWIQPSKSEFGAAVLFVKKKDGGLRMCVDYRGLNNITVKDRTPLPAIADLREQVRGAKFKTKLDIRDAFHTIRIKPEDTYKTAFRTRYGHFEFTVCPFGACNSPATFVRMMNRIFGDLYDKGVIAYVDDMLIYSNSYDKHLELIKEVFSRLQTAELNIKLSKCIFAQEQIEFCGMLITSEGVAIQQDSISAVCEFPEITTLKHLQSFIGSIRFFQDYIPQLAQIAGPLYDLTKITTAWEWNVDHQSIVRIIQHHLTTAPLLKFFDPTLETEVHTDASSFAIGGWIGQRHMDGKSYPIAYWSRRMIPAERNYPIHEQELLAVVQFVKQHRRYLHGIPFTIFTDHRALEHIQTQPHLSARQVRWLQILQEFSPTIRYISGESNSFADWLSRRPDFMKVECPQCQHLISDPFPRASISSILTTGLQDHFNIEILTAQATDPICKELVAFAADPDTIPTARKRYVSEFVFEDGLWKHGSLKQVVIPESLQLQVLEYFHNPVHRGHYGKSKMLHTLKKFVYWLNMDQSVTNFVTSCDGCQRSKTVRGLPPGKLHPLPIPTARFQSLAMDFCFLPVSTDGDDSIWVIVDRLTKFVKLIPCRQTVSAPELATLFFNNWYCAGYGFPADIISDMDSKLVSTFWKSFCSQLQINHRTSTARHQRTDGQSEITIQIVKGMLKRHINYSQSSWKELLPAISFAMNNSISSATLETPFYLAHAFQIPEYPLFNQITGPASTVLATHSAAIAKAQTCIVHAQVQMAKFYDKKHSVAPNYHIGDEVLLSRNGIKWSPDSERSQKLLQPWLGPFKIIAVDSDKDNIRLDLPLVMKCHNEFHVECLRPYNSPQQHFPSRQVPECPIAQLDEYGEKFEVDEVLDTKLVGRGKKRTRKYLIRWLGYSAQHDTWEPASCLDGCEELLQEFNKSRCMKDMGA